MFVTQRGRTLRLLRRQGIDVLVWTTAAAAAWAGTEQLGGSELLPATPLIVTGAAICLLIGLRAHAAWTDWRAAQRLWNRVLAGTRVFAGQVASYLPAGREEIEEIVVQQAAWVHVLRSAVRRQDPFEDESVRRLVWPEQLRDLKKATNPAHAVLHLQISTVARLARDGVITEERLRSLDATLTDLLEAQTACEGLATSSAASGFSSLGRTLLPLYAGLLPLGLTVTMGPWSIVGAVGTCIVLGLVDEAARGLERPMAPHAGGLPLTHLALSAERDSLERIGSPDLPVVPPAVDGVLL